MAKPTKKVTKKSWKKELFLNAMQQRHYWEVVKGQFESVLRSITRDSHRYRGNDLVLDQSAMVMNGIILTNLHRAETNMFMFGVMGTEAELQQAKLLGLKDFMRDNYCIMHHLTFDGMSPGIYGTKTEEQFRDHINLMRQELLVEMTKDHKEPTPEDTSTAKGKLRRIEQLDEEIKTLRTAALLQLSTDPSRSDREAAKELKIEIQLKKAVANGEFVEDVYEDEESEDVQEEE